MERIFFVAKNAGFKQIFLPAENAKGALTVAAQGTGGVAYSRGAWCADGRHIVVQSQQRGGDRYWLSLADSATGKIIIDLLKELARTEDTTIVAVTHDESIAKQARITFTLRDGKLVK